MNIEVFLVLPSGVIQGFALKPEGWTYCTGPFGAHVFNVADGLATLRLTAGVGVGGGIATVDRIEVTGGDYRTLSVPAASLERTRGKLTIRGPITIPPRGALRIDFTDADHLFYERAFVDSTVRGLPIPKQHNAVHSTRDPWLVTMRDGLPPANLGGEELAGAIGHWFVLGNPVPNEGGGNQIAVVTLTPDFGTVLLRARGHANRCWLDNLDKNNGQPLPTANKWPEGYSLAGGLSKSTTLPMFHEPLGYGDPSKMKPRRWSNAGHESAYEAALLGEHVQSGDWHSWEGGYSRHDGQHLIRLTGALEAAADLCGDPCAAFDLWVAAHDVTYAHGNPPHATQGLGSTYYGSRDVAWSLWTLQAAGHSLATRLETEIRLAQMINGCWSNYPYATWWGFNPSPWEVSEAVPTPLQHRTHAAQGFEQEFTAMAVRDVRYLLNVYPNVAKLGFRPKWLGPAEDTNVAGGQTASIILRRIQQWAGHADFFPIMFLGHGALVHEDKKPWLDAMLTIQVEGHGIAPDHATLLQWLRTSYALRYQAPCAIAALEALLG